MNKYTKESYITARAHPDQWKNHVNVKTLEQYAQHITGSVLDVGCNTVECFKDDRYHENNILTGLFRK